MNDKLGVPFWIEIGLFDCVFVIGYKQLTLDWIFLRVQNESGVNDTARQWKHVEGTMDQMVPFTGDIQAPDFTVASCFIFN